MDSGHLASAGPRRWWASASSPGQQLSNQDSSGPSPAHSARPSVEETAPSPGLVPPGWAPMMERRLQRLQTCVDGAAREQGLAVAALAAQVAALADRLLLAEHSIQVLQASGPGAACGVAGLSPRTIPEAPLLSTAAAIQDQLISTTAATEATGEPNPGALAAAMRSDRSTLSPALSDLSSPPRSADGSSAASGAAADGAGHRRSSGSSLSSPEEEYGQHDTTRGGGQYCAAGDEGAGGDQGGLYGSGFVVYGNNAAAAAVGSPIETSALLQPELHCRDVGDCSPIKQVVAGHSAGPEDGAPGGSSATAAAQAAGSPAEPSASSPVVWRSNDMLAARDLDSASKPVAGASPQLELHPSPTAIQLLRSPTSPSQQPARRSAGSGAGHGDAMAWAVNQLAALDGDEANQLADITPLSQKQQSTTDVIQGGAPVGDVGPLEPAVARKSEGSSCSVQSLGVAAAVAAAPRVGAEGQQPQEGEGATEASAVLPAAAQLASGGWQGFGPAGSTLHQGTPQLNKVHPATAPEGLQCNAPGLAAATAGAAVPTLPLGCVSPGLPLHVTTAAVAASAALAAAAATAASAGPAAAVLPAPKAVAAAAAHGPPRTPSSYVPLAAAGRAGAAAVPPAAAAAAGVAGPSPTASVSSSTRSTRSSVAKARSRAAAALVAFGSRSAAGGPKPSGAAALASDPAAAAAAGQAAKPAPESGPADQASGVKGRGAAAAAGAAGTAKEQAFGGGKADAVTAAGRSSGGGSAAGGVRDRVATVLVFHEDADDEDVQLMNVKQLTGKGRYGDAVAAAAGSIGEESGKDAKGQRQEKRSEEEQRGEGCATGDIGGRPSRYQQVLGRRLGQGSTSRGDRVAAKGVGSAAVESGGLRVHHSQQLPRPPGPAARHKSAAEGSAAVVARREKQAQGCSGSTAKAEAAAAPAEVQVVPAVAAGSSVAAVVASGLGPRSSWGQGLSRPASALAAVGGPVAAGGLGSSAGGATGVAGKQGASGVASRRWV